MIWKKKPSQRSLSDINPTTLHVKIHDSSSAGLGVVSRYSVEFLEV